MPSGYGPLEHAETRPTGAAAERQRGRCSKTAVVLGRRIVGRVVFGHERWKFVWGGRAPRKCGFLWRWTFGSLGKSYRIFSVILLGLMMCDDVGSLSGMTYFSGGWGVPPKKPGELSTYRGRLPLFTGHTQRTCSMIYRYMIPKHSMYGVFTYTFGVVFSRGQCKSASLLGVWDISSIHLVPVIPMLLGPELRSELSGHPNGSG